MMIVPAGVKVHLALGYTDMRKGLDGLVMLVQQTPKQKPFSGHHFAFRGKKAFAKAAALSLRQAHGQRPDRTSGLLEHACRGAELERH